MQVRLYCLCYFICESCDKLPVLKDDTPRMSSFEFSKELIFVKLIENFYIVLVISTYFLFPFFLSLA